MKKTFFLLLTFLIVGLSPIFSNLSEAKQKIRISYFNVPPFIIYDIQENKLIGGALYEFLEQHIEPLIDSEFIWDKYPSSIPRLLVSITTRSTDAIALLSYSHERVDKMVFTKLPFFISSPAIAMLKGNTLNKIEKIEDILPLRIGYGEHIHITPFMRDKRINYDLIATGNYNEQNLKKMMAGRIDAVYTPDIISLLAVIKNLELDDDVKVIKLPDKESSNHVVFAKNMEDVAVRYNKAFEQIDGTKIFFKILSKYIDIPDL